MKKETKKELIEWVKELAYVLGALASTVPALLLFLFLE